MISRADLRDLGILVGRFAWPYWPIIALSVALGAAMAVIVPVQPLVLAPAIDVATASRVPAADSWRDLSLNNVGPTLARAIGIEGAPWRVVAVSVVLYVALVATASGLAFANLLVMSRLRVDIFRDLQSDVYRHVLGLSMSFFVRQRTGDLASRLMNDAYQAAQAVESIVRGALQGGIQLVFYVVVLLRTDALLTGGVAVVAGLHLVITRVLRDRIRGSVVDQFGLFATLSALVHEALMSIRVVKCFGAERFEHARFVRGASDLRRITLRGAVFKHAETPLRETADALGLALTVLLAFGALASERLTVAGLVLFVVMVRQALGPLGQLSNTVLSLQALLGSAALLLRLRETVPAVADGRREAGPLREAIRAEHVSFRYDQGVEAVRDVSLEVRRGEMVALVGPSGAGKSTLADLVVRLYDPAVGRVTYDGTDVREFWQESYRRQFGIVSQECLLFNATVTENIAYGRVVDVEAVRQAARVAHAEEFVERLPLGYDTVVGDRGVRLSGGQRQRIAIARAVYGRPAVLLLDEATSALDSESERHVQAAIDELVRGATVLVVAHRLSTVLKADRIVVMNDGRVEAVGPHAELLRTCALYRRLCEAQFHEAVKAGVGDTPVSTA